MKILVRLPNWLGDMVMALGFIDGLSRAYPGAEVSIIAKKGLEDVLPYFPQMKHQFLFSKGEFPGVRGAWKFGRTVRAAGPFDLFFCLPDSFSSAVMGFATGAKKRVGFSKEGRGLFFTHTFKKPGGVHRVEEYVSLLEGYTGKREPSIKVGLNNPFERFPAIVVNINSEASSRRLTVSKAVEVISALHAATTEEIILVGSPKEKPLIDAVHCLLPANRIQNRAGDKLPALLQLLGSARVLLSTDSGPAHLGNALGTPTVVLVGAGNEANTAPYNPEGRHVIRLGRLSCEPCGKNVCVRFEVPQCLEQLDTPTIVEAVKKEARNYE